MSSGLDRIEAFLAASRPDPVIWLTVAFGCGIAAWFALPLRSNWLWLMAGCAVVTAAVTAGAMWAGRQRRAIHHPLVARAAVSLALVLAGGCGLVWSKSALVGAPALTRPYVRTIAGEVLARADQPAEARIRLLLAIRSPEDPTRAVRVRINLPLEQDRPGLAEGATIRLRARLMPPAAPMLPGSYDFARAAWFAGIAGSGTALGPIELLAPAHDKSWLAALRRSLSAHVAAALPGSRGGIASALASGDRGAIAPEDEAAMRDAGLSHLLSVSGLHVSAVMAAAYVLFLRASALWTWLALRVRLPLLASGAAAGAGLFYTLLTGAEVPTVRSVVGGLLVLAAVALGRDALSLRLLAVAGFVVMLLWPEAVIGPSFQLSFGAVLAIVALHEAGWMRRLAQARAEPWWQAGCRKLVVLLVTGVVIEIAIMPIGLYHFHRAGLYGALANVVAIPLTTLAIMPMVALALLLDVVGLGGPFWWLAGKAIGALLALSHLIADSPGAITMLPAMGSTAFSLFIAGGLWLALWNGPARLLGLLPIGVAMIWLALLTPPDILISRDGRHVGFANLAPGRLIVLREPQDGEKRNYARDTLLEAAGMRGTPMTLAQWPGARCNTDFCQLTLRRDGRFWRILLSRGADPVPVRSLSAACSHVDIVIADRWLPPWCRPALIKVDRDLLQRSGGLSIDLTTLQIATVAQGQGEQGWWRAVEPAARRPSTPQSSTSMGHPTDNPRQTSPQTSPG